MLDLSGSSTGLVAEYRFHTGAGDTAYDSAGSNDGTINGASWIDGVDGKALSFDGSNDYVRLPYNSNLDIYDDGSFTITAWIKTSETDDWNGIYSKSGAGGGAQYVIDNGRQRIEYSGGTFESDTTVADGRWHLISVRYNGSDATFYLDGKKDGTVANIGWNTGSGDGFNIGAERGENNYLQGDVDAVRIYDESLTQTQIASIYNSGSWKTDITSTEGDTSKVLDLSFQHQNSSYVFDTSGYNNHGERINGVGQQSAVKCKVGRCYSFDGNDDGVYTGTNTLYNENEGTWMAWVNPDTISSSGFGHASPNSVISATSGSCDDAYALMVGNSDQAGAHVDDGPNNNVISGGNIAENEWNHLTATYESGIFQLYVNGMLVANTSTDGTAIEDQNCPEYIGNRDNAVNYFDGKIDQVKVFNRSLSQQEIIGKTQGLEGGGTVLDLRFNRDGGDKVHGYSGQNNHGTLQPNESAGPKWVDGVTGNALEFDGVDDYVESSGDFDFSQEDEVTLVAWINGYESSNDDIIFGAGYDWILRPEGMYMHDNSESKSISFNNYPSKDSWHQIVGAWNGSVMKIYLDGEFKKKSSYDKSFDIAGDATYVRIGGRNSDNGFMYDGKIDLVKIYPYALSESKIQQLYNQGATDKLFNIGSGSPGSVVNLQDGLVLSQTFNRIETCGQSDTVSCPSGVSGEVAVDESGEANHGELVNGPTEKNANECRSGGCLDFDGNNDEVQVNDDSSLDGSDGWTMSYWIKSEFLSGNYPDGWHGGISKVNGSNYGYSLDYDGWGDDLDVILWDGSRNIELASGNDLTNDMNEWTHVVATYNPGNEVVLYQNGQRFDSSSVGDFGDVSNNAKLKIGEDAESSNNLNASLDQVRVYNHSLSNQEVWKLYTRGRDWESGMAGPVAHYPIQRRASPLPDVSGEGNSGELDLLGEAGTFNTSDGEWKTVRFERNYKNPVIVGTTNTKVGESAIYFEVRNVQSHKAEMRLCESEGGDNDGCDTHGTERAGYVVIDAASVDDIPGIEAGSFENTEANGASFSESFSTAPLVFTQPQTDRGEGEVVSWTTSRSTSGFNVQVCDQNSLNGCYSPDEKIGWIAVESGNEPFEQLAEADNLSNEVGSSNWASTTFDNSFSERPVGVFSVQNNDGGQDPKVDEIRNVNTNSMEMRFCELETGDTCDGHANMEYGYLAVTEGLLTYSNGNFPRYVNTGRGKALEFDGSDDYVDIPEDIVSSDQDLTVSYWARTDGTSSMRPLTLRGDVAFVTEYENDGTIDVWVDGTWHTGLAEYSAGEWIQWTLVYDNSESEWTLFDNSEEAASFTDSLASGSNNNVIGSDWWGGNDERHFNGKIDDVRIYPYALSQSQVEKVMNGGGMVSVGG